MKIKLKTVGLLSGVFLSVLMLSSPLYAEPGDGKMHDDEKGWEEKVNKMYEKLGLSEEQRNQLKAQKESHRDEMKGTREQLQTKHQEFQAEIQKADFDAGKLKAINNDIKSLHNKIADYRLESILKVREILTPEQFAKFMQMKEEHKGEWKGKFKDKMKEKKQERQEAPDL